MGSPVPAHLLPCCNNVGIDRQTRGNLRMKFLGHAYRFFSNFVFLAMVYYSLNFMEKYQQRAILALLVLIYAGMRAATTLRSFYFFQRIERLELEARRLAAAAGEGPAASAPRQTGGRARSTAGRGGGTEA